MQSEIAWLRKEGSNSKDFCVPVRTFLSFDLASTLGLL